VQHRATVRTRWFQFLSDWDQPSPSKRSWIDTSSRDPAVSACLDPVDLFGTNTLAKTWSRLQHGFESRSIRQDEVEAQRRFHNSERAPATTKVAMTKGVAEPTPFVVGTAL